MPRGRDSLWDIDLAEVTNIKKYNTGIQPLPDKTHQSVIKSDPTKGVNLPIDGSNSL